MPKGYSNCAVGLRRPPHVFFYDIDYFKEGKKNVIVYLIPFCSEHLKSFSIYKTQHGYHVIGTPFTRKIWFSFKRRFKTDFTLELKKQRSQVLRISVKWNRKTGGIISPAPVKVFGNFSIKPYLEQWRFAYYSK